MANMPEVKAEPSTPSLMSGPAIVSTPQSVKVDCRSFKPRIISILSVSNSAGPSITPTQRRGCG